MLTFFEVWPAFHICAGQGVLFALTIMGDPQLLFRTLQEPLKCPSWCAVLHHTEKTQALQGLGGGSLVCISVRLHSSSGLTDWVYYSETFDAQTTCETFISQPAVCAANIQ